MVLPERIVPVPSATYAASFAISILRGCIGRPSRHAAVFVRQGLRDGRSGAADRLDAKPFVIFHHDDASLGRPDDAPYDRIIVTAATPSIDPALVAQLADDGRIVAPVGDEDLQELVVRDARGHEQHHGAVRFVPLRGRAGFS